MLSDVCLYLQIAERMWTLCTLHMGCYDGEEFGATTMQLLQALHLHNIRECYGKFSNEIYGVNKKLDYI